MTANFAFQFLQFGFTRAREAGIVCDLAAADCELSTRRGHELPRAEKDGRILMRSLDSMLVG
jgi:hypothetical protein